MTFIFIQHSADREGHRERLAEKQGVLSTVTSRRKQWGRVHVNCRFFSERTASSSSLRPTTLSLSAVLYSAYTTVRPSRCRRLNARPNQQRKWCQDRMSHAFVPQALAASRRTAEVRRSSHVDARSSTTKILGPGPNTGYALALLMMQNRVLLIL